VTGPVVSPPGYAVVDVASRRSDDQRPAIQRAPRRANRKAHRGRGAADTTHEERGVEAFTEETAKTRRFPGIAFRGDDARRRAWVIGTGLDVWEIIHMLEDFGSPEALAADMPLSLSHVRLAMAYREAYPDEIDEAIADNRRPVDDVDVLFPFIDVASA
jgi:uncharacterized protein (DUF433 family)